MGGLAERARLIIVCRVARNDDEARASINQVLEVGATSLTNVVHLHHLNNDQELTRNHTDALQRKLIATQVEVRELQDHQVSLERRVFKIERQLAICQDETSRKPNNTPREYNILYSLFWIYRLSLCIYTRDVFMFIVRPRDFISR